jgi:hypothetical protein
MSSDTNTKERSSRNVGVKLRHVPSSAGMGYDVVLEVKISQKAQVSCNTRKCHATTTTSSSAAAVAAAVSFLLRLLQLSI